MILNVEIDLSSEEMEFLKKFFDGSVPNTIFWKTRSSQYFQQKEFFSELSDKGVISIDSLSNCHLTKVGQDILKQISRENIIDKLI